jgi:hypothetical protein
VLAIRPTRPSRLLSGFLALALASLSSAICFAATSQMQAQQEICSAMSHETGSGSATAQDCCAAQNPEFAGLAPAASVRLIAAPALAIGVMPPAPPILIAPPGLIAFDSGVPKASSPPTYLLVSSFRI